MYIHNLQKNTRTHYSSVANSLTYKHMHTCTHMYTYTHMIYIHIHKPIHTFITYAFVSSYTFNIHARMQINRNTQAHTRTKTYTHNHYDTYT